MYLLGVLTVIVFIGGIPEHNALSLTTESCPVVRCARPDCPEEHWIQNYFDDKKRCPACQDCATFCPNIVCAAVIPPCPESERFNEILEFEGEKCLGCERCREATTTSRPLQCPVFKCRDPGCAKPKRKYFRLDDGTRCEGCPKCRKRDICPKVKCKRIKRCPSGKVKKPKFIRKNGVRCRMCDRCVKRKRGRNN